MKTKITKRLVDTLKPGPADRTIFDFDVPGFAVRVRKTGGMSYAVEYKAGRGRGAPTRRVTIGPVGKMTPEEARAVARRVLGSVAHGKDPAAEKAGERRTLPLGEVIDAFLREHVEAKRKASTAAWMRDALERILKPALGAKRPNKVARQDAARLHSSMSDRPVQANRTLAILSALYSWAEKMATSRKDATPFVELRGFPKRRVNGSSRLTN